MKAIINGVTYVGTSKEIRDIVKGSTGKKTVKKSSKGEIDHVASFKKKMEKFGCTFLNEKSNQYTRKDGSKVEGMLFSYKLPSGKTGQYQNTIKHPKPWKLN